MRRPTILLQTRLKLIFLIFEYQKMVCYIEFSAQYLLRFRGQGKPSNSTSLKRNVKESAQVGTFFTNKCTKTALSCSQLYPIVVGYLRIFSLISSSLRAGQAFKLYFIQSLKQKDRILAQVWNVPKIAFHYRRFVLQDQYHMKVCVSFINSCFTSP